MSRFSLLPAALLACLVVSAAGAPPAFDARLSSYAYPFPVKSLAIDSQDQALELVYMDVTPTASNGSTVVLLHGKNFSGAYWKRTIETLVERGFRVVVPDQIGFGKSSKPEHYQYSFHALAVHTCQLLDALDVRRASVVGHSMGGMLAVRFALMYPDRVDRLVLVNPIGLEDWKRGVPYVPVAQALRAELEKPPSEVKEYMQKSYFHGDWHAAYDALVEIQAGWRAGPDRRVIALTTALTSDMVFTQPVLYEFGDLAVATLLIIGQRDRTAIGKATAPAAIAETLGDYPQLGKRAAKAIKGAKLVELDGVGHVPQFEDYDRYAEALVPFLEAGAGG